MHSPGPKKFTRTDVEQRRQRLLCPGPRIGRVEDDGNAGGTSPCHILANGIRVGAGDSKTIDVVGDPERISRSAVGDKGKAQMLTLLGGSTIGEQRGNEQGGSK